MCTGSPLLSPAPSPDNWSSPPRPPRGLHPEKWIHIRKGGVRKEKDQTSRGERGEEDGTGHTRGSRRGEEERAVAATTTASKYRPACASRLTGCQRENQKKNTKSGVWRASALTRPRATVHRARRREGSAKMSPRSSEMESLPPLVRVTSCCLATSSFGGLLPASATLG